MINGKKSQRNNRSFANLVLNHIDNNNNSDPEVSNINLEFSTGNDTQFFDKNNYDNLKDQT